MGAVSRLQVGSPYGSFYGYQNAGIFQTQAEIDASQGLVKQNDL